MTGTICSVAACKSNFKKSKEKGENIMFFRFPKDKIVQKEWVKKCYRKDKFDPTNKRVCSKHFTLDDYKDRLQAELLNTVPKKLKVNAVPSLLLKSVPDNVEDSEVLDHDQKPLAEENEQIVYPIQHKNESRVIPVITCVNNEENNCSRESHSCSSTNCGYVILQRKHDMLLRKNRALEKKIKAQERDIFLMNKKH